jgi:hypothetical protein
MEKQRRRSYLFLLQRPSSTARHEAAKRLRELGMTVVAQFGQVAIEAKATLEQVEAASDLGIFSAQLKGAMSKDHLARLNEEQLRVVQQWNTRFSPSYRRMTKDLSLEGRSWGDPEMETRPGFTAIDPEDFKQFLAEYEDKTGERLTPREPAPSKGKPEKQKRMSAKEFTDYEKRLREAYKDPTLAYHLARLGYRLEPRHRDLLLKLPQALIDALLERFFSEAACWKMTGEISVGIVFVESSQSGGPKFSNTERNEICQEIFDGHSFLTEEHPSGNLSWVYDTQFIKINVANGSGDPDEAYWRDPAMAQVNYFGNTYTAAWSSVADYREDMRIRNRSAHAIVIFVTPYANSWHGYAGSGRITLANKNNWGGWGRGTIDRITAHETSHLFGSADEYSGSGTPCSSCASLHGCDRIPNGNCASCSHPHQDCVMDGNSRRICGYTRGHIGWGHIFLETTTDDVMWAGTDDDVWLDIGDRQFYIDTPDWDDRERGNVEGYALWSPGLTLADIKRIMIRKSPDGFAGGWRLKRVRVWYGGNLICEQNNINKWLEDDHRVWVGCITARDIVSTLRVKVTTADVSWAGTDDDITLTLAGRDWDLDNEGHDDFERGNTDTFDLDPGSGLYVSDIHFVRIHKSPDGFAGGWKLKGIEIIVNGNSVYNNQSINQWIEDDHRTWSASF